MTELSWTRDWPSYWLSSRWDAQTRTGLLWVLDSRSLALKVLPAYALMALVGVGAALVLG